MHCGILFPTLRSLFRAAVRTLIIVSVGVVASGMYIAGREGCEEFCAIPEQVVVAQKDPAPSEDEVATAEEPVDSAGEIKVEPSSAVRLPSATVEPLQESGERLEAQVSEWSNVRAEPRGSAEVVTEIGPGQSFWVPEARHGAWWPVFARPTSLQPYGYIYRDLIVIR